MVDLTTRLVGPKCHPEGICGGGYRDPEGKQVMFIGISPGSDEMRTGMPMTGRSGKLMDAILGAVGWSRDRVYVTNVVCTQCQEPTTEQTLECWPRLEAEVALVKPKLVVALGAYVARQFFGDRPFTSPSGKGARGVLDWYSKWGCYIMPTYHTAALLYGDSGKFVQNDIVRDLSKIREFFDYPPNPKVTFNVVESVEQAQTILNNLPRNTFVALDIETPLKDDDETAAIEDPISCFSISDGGRTWWFPGEFARRVQWPMDVQWTYHNGPYDTITLARRTGVLLPIVHDTMYMSYALDERGGVHSLKANARETEGAGFYEEAWGNGAVGTKEYDKRDGRDVWIVTTWDARRKADPSGFRAYNAKDAAYTARIAHRYHRRMQADGMLDLYTSLLIPAVNTYGRMQQHGMYVNPDRWEALLRAWMPLRDQKLDEFQRIVHEAGGPEEINPRSAVQMRQFMYGTMRLPGGPSTGQGSIEALAGTHPFVDALLDYRHIDKALNTYVAGLWKTVKTTTMRVHPWAKLHGVVTGRVAYFNPAINTTPRAYSPNPYLQKLKSLFTAPPGKVLIEIDYRQAECWIAWLYSQDPNLLADLNSGDLHRQTAAYVNKVPPHAVTTYQRARAKNTTFGMFYGIGPKKLAHQNAIPLAEAQMYIGEWRARYTEYPKYADAMLSDAWHNGEIVTITGRKRRYPCSGVMADRSIATETVNFPIQSTSHDYLMASIIEGWPVLQALGAAIMLDVHDACLIEANENNWETVALTMAEIMGKPRFGVDLSLPVEIKMGASWGSMDDTNL